MAFFRCGSFSRRRRKREQTPCIRMGGRAVVPETADLGCFAISSFVISTKPRRQVYDARLAVLGVLFLCRTRGQAPGSRRRRTPD